MCRLGSCNDDGNLRAALGGNDYIDWSQLGGNFAIVGSPAAVTSNLGASATVRNASGPAFMRLDQNSGWSGNFSAGDALLWTNNTPGPLIIDFLAPVRGAGAQIQADNFGGFTGFLCVFGSDDSTLLGSYSLNGISNSTGDNSAIFLGVSDTLADIGKIEYSVYNQARMDFAINRLSLITESAPVPEPSTIALLGLGLAGLGYARRRARKD